MKSSCLHIQSGLPEVIVDRVKISALGWQFYFIWQATSYWVLICRLKPPRSYRLSQFHLRINRSFTMNFVSDCLLFFTVLSTVHLAVYNRLIFIYSWINGRTFQPCVISRDSRATAQESGRFVPHSAIKFNTGVSALTIFYLPSCRSDGRRGCRRYTTTTSDVSAVPGVSTLGRRILSVKLHFQTLLRFTARRG